MAVLFWYLVKVTLLYSRVHWTSQCHVLQGARTTWHVKLVTLLHNFCFLSESWYNFVFKFYFFTVLTVNTPYILMHFILSYNYFISLYQKLSVPNKLSLMTSIQWTLVKLTVCTLIIGFTKKAKLPFYLWNRNWM